MPYCTQAQLEARYGVNLLIEISDRADVPTGAVDTDLIDLAIADADALIDSYLKGRYALPLSGTPPVVGDLSRRISIYNAHANVAGDKITRDYEQALKQLKDIASGVITLDVAGVEPASSGGNQVISNDQERLITAASMKGYI